MADPQRIGRYLIKRPLGRGGMGTVYLAEDPMLKRWVAIKVVTTFDEAREHAMARFRREAEISAQLNHPNVVTVFDVGMEPDVGPFLAMEYVEGKSLAKHIKDKDLDLETSVRVLIQAMRALRAAHRLGIVHRDVKPENILISENGRAKLMDFGIARTLGQMTLSSERPMFREPSAIDPEDAVVSQGYAQTLALRITSTGDFLGSPAYSPPEVLKGSDGTPSSDRYSFAATTFELLTGRLPHPGSNLTAILIHTLQYPVAIPPDMPPKLAAVFRRALTADPDDRYATLLDFIEELIDALPGPTNLRSRLFASLAQEDDVGDIMSQRRNQAQMGVEAPQLEPEYQSNRKLRPGGESVRIALDEEIFSSQDSGRAIQGRITDKGMSARRMHVRREREEPGFGGWRIVKWAAGIIIFLQAFWWLYPRIMDPHRKLDLESIPTDAEVYLDGNLVGRTPIHDLKVSGRAKSLRLDKEGHIPRFVAVDEGDVKLRIYLDAKRQGFQVISDPPGADVHLNSVYVGRTPMNDLPAILGGVGEIRISLDGYKPWRSVLMPGEAIPNPVKLEKID